MVHHSGLGSPIGDFINASFYLLRDKKKIKTFSSASTLIYNE
jgi:hypothetical protein